MQTISTENKIKKIAEAIPLITKFALGSANTYRDDKHIYKTLIKISSLLKVNQWLRIEDKPYSIEDISNIERKQGTFIKPASHLWYSKGEWIFGEMCCKPEKYLSLIEVDYSRILVLTTKKDYLNFEKQYCIYKKYKKTLSRGFSIIFNKNRKTKIKTKIKTKNQLTKQPKICTYEIKWQDVAKQYDGIAIVPNPKPYFTKQKMTDIDFENHIWLKTFDVSSLAIWKQTDKLPITKSITIGQLQDFASKSDIEQRTLKYCNTLIDKITKAQDKLNIIL
uniref:Uncharacterized protein n=1 Tax=viral metagenome TaxID=1070528 RepID=A0A6C0HKQ4_9ZZZZ